MYHKLYYKSYKNKKKKIKNKTKQKTSLSVYQGYLILAIKSNIIN
jgi:hypothetical protein